MTTGRRWAPRVLILLLAGGSIAALLADLYGIVPMAPVFWLVSVPAMVALAVAAGLPRVGEELAARIRVGAFAGVVGVLGYDLARIPFALAGQRVFAPIESYGILIAGASSSSGLTSTLGWLYHLSNGVTFGIAYAIIAARRPWPLGVLWALVLETVAVVSPFAARYGLSGHPVPIAVAYLAHLFYGYPLGRLCQNLDGTTEALRRTGRRTVPVTLILAVAVVAAWHRPWHARPAGERDGVPVAIVRIDRFDPAWLRTTAGGCVLVDNRSTSAYRTPAGPVPAASVAALCFGRPGVHRVRLGTRPYSGGFVYVDATR